MQPHVSIGSWGSLGAEQLLRLPGVTGLGNESHQGCSSHKYSDDTQQRPCAEQGLARCSIFYPVLHDPSNFSTLRLTSLLAPANSRHLRYATSKKGNRFFFLHRSAILPHWFRSGSMPVGLWAHPAAKASVGGGALTAWLPAECASCQRIPAASIPARHSQSARVGSKRPTQQKTKSQPEGKGDRSPSSFGELLTSGEPGSTAEHPSGTAAKSDVVDSSR